MIPLGQGRKLNVPELIRGKYTEYQARTITVRAPTGKRAQGPSLLS